MARSLEQIIGKARRGERRLRPWLRNNYLRLLPLVGRGRADWAPVLAVLREAGVRDARGQLPSHETLARAWREVEKRLASRGDAAGPAPAPTPSIARGVRRLPAEQHLSPAEAHRGPPRPRTAPADGPAPSASRRSHGIRDTVAARTVEEGMSDAIRRAIDRV